MLTSQRELSWGSCKSISANLQLAYRLAFPGRAKFFFLPPAPSRTALAALAESLRRANPARIVFLDHLPHPLPLLRDLSLAYEGKALPELAFHVYGDFTLYPAAWLAAEEFLRGQRTRFFCASARHLALMRGFLRGTGRALAELPFPVDTRAFRRAPALRREWRRRLKLDGPTFLYAGRISLQKNVTLLVDSFARLPANARLLLAGAEDDLDAPLFGVHLPAGTYGATLRARIASSGGRVRWLGAVDARTLNGLYNAADHYVCLGLHHDEDFGMSVAEGQCTGLPALLTDWGGFTSFIATPDDGALVPVKIGAGGLRIDRTRARDELLRAASRPAEEGRAARAARNRARFSVEACARGLRESGPAPRFPGFSDSLATLAFQYSGARAPFAKGARRGSSYERIYGAYFE